MQPIFGHSCVLVFDTEMHRSEAEFAANELGWWFECFDHGEPEAQGNWCATVRERSGPCAPMHVMLNYLFENVLFT